MSLRITFLGTGTSHGVPMIGCRCEVCQSTDPRDARSRPSILIELLRPAPGPSSSATRFVLVDTSPDLRMQALRHDVTRVDAILYTHSHADHILGLDEIRRYNVTQGGGIPCFGDDRTLSDIRTTFHYIFARGTTVGGGIPDVRLFRIGGVFQLGAEEVVPVPLFHGPRPILGFRIGTFAYLTDCNRIPDASLALLDGVETLVLDALRHRPHPTHFSVSEALDVIAHLRPSRAFLTHICHDLPHARTCADLPAPVELAYDGLVLDA